MLRIIRNTHTFAFLQGMREAFASDGSFGRTHSTDMDWCDAYDRGGNLGDWLAAIVGRQPR